MKIDALPQRQQGGGEIVKRRLKCRLAAVALFQANDSGTFGRDDENLDDFQHRIINQQKNTKISGQDNLKTGRCRLGCVGVVW